MTYQRHHILEEAIDSFLQQDYQGDDIEMVVLNDSPVVQYKFDHPKVRIINMSERFSSLGKKLEYGFKRCKGEDIYRLDDDDLLTPWAMTLVNGYVSNDADIFRCAKAYFLVHNVSQGLSDNVNNGNTYAKRFVENVKMSDKSIGEDVEITYHSGGRIFQGDEGRYSMIYRWGMNTYHISGLGTQHAEDNEYLFSQIDKTAKETGVIELHPHFDNDYYNLIK